MSNINHEAQTTINGVTGRYNVVKSEGVRAPACFDAQTWISSRPIAGYGRGAQLTVNLRFDDQCKNKHNTFAITGDVTIPRRRDSEARGCLDDEIATVFPELAHLIKWHLCSTDGPIHYLANTLYFAGNRDSSGKSAGEATSYDEALVFGQNPITHVLRRDFWQWLQDYRASTSGDFDFEIITVHHADQGKPEKYQYAPKYTYGGFDKVWHACPFNTESEALNFLFALQHCDPHFKRIATAWSAGKARELDNARSSAVWPEATDAELSQPREVLERVLMARLPALVDRMRADIESAGFLWSAE